MQPAAALFRQLVADFGLEVNEEKMESEEATKYRANAARANYLSQDRTDIQFATKEASSTMANPVASDKEKVKRIVRYLVGRPRAVMCYPWQEMPSELSVFSDSEWAGCRSTRKKIRAVVYLCWAGTSLKLIPDSSAQ